LERRSGVVTSIFCARSRTLGKDAKRAESATGSRVRKHRFGIKVIELHALWQLRENLVLNALRHLLGDRASHFEAVVWQR
jgi:hypothetical protein